MSFLEAVIYGVIQGLTEFLPISSSGHLALLPHFLNISDPGVLFDLTMHVGTAAAVILYFRKDLIFLIKQLWGVLTRKLKIENASFLVNAVLATVMTIILAVPLKDYGPRLGRDPKIIAFSLIFFGLWLFAADKWGKVIDDKKMDSKIRARDSLWIGFFQALALFPGVSRSGATLTIARMRGLGREEATRFSFLLSLPIIIGGFVFKLPEILGGKVSFEWETCLVGLLVSFVSGLLTIHFFLVFIRKMGLGIFALYRIILGVALLLMF